MWKPDYFDVCAFAQCFHFHPHGELISKEEAESPTSVRLAHWLEWQSVLDKNSDDSGAELTLGLTSKVAALLGYGYVLVVPDSDPAYHTDDRGSCMRASTLLWMRAKDLQP